MLKYLRLRCKLRNFEKNGVVRYFSQRSQRLPVSSVEKFLSDHVTTMRYSGIFSHVENKYIEDWRDQLKVIHNTSQNTVLKISATIS